jgi:hypothetical protein
MKEEGLGDLLIDRVLTRGDKRAGGCEVGWCLGFVLHFISSFLGVGTLEYKRSEMRFIASLDLFTAKIKGLDAKRHSLSTKRLAHLLYMRLGIGRGLMYVCLEYDLVSIDRHWNLDCILSVSRREGVSVSICIDDWKMARR